MSNKIKTDHTQEVASSQPQSEPPTTNPLTELEQLRHIVFGEAQNRLSNQISTLRSDMEKALSSQQKQFTEHLAQMQESTDQQFAQLNDQLQLSDSIHDDNESNLQKNIDNAVAEHDLFAAATKQNFATAAQSLASESNSLSDNFDAQIEQLKQYLESVSRDLTSSKTDRKTLASLLATMATNLQDESA